MGAPPRWIERMSRVGIAAKGLVYLTIGALATGAALQLGGVIPGSTGVFRILRSQPLGNAILGLLAVGLAMYTLWLFVQAIVDPDRNGTSVVGGLNRLGLGNAGLVHAALTLKAARLALGMSGGVGGGAW